MKRHGMDSPFFFPSPAAVFFVTVRTSSLPLQSGAGVPPCSPQSCHRTVPDVPETRPGLPSNKVEEEKVGGGGLLCLEDQSASELQHDFLSVPSRAPDAVHLLSRVICPSAPSRRVLITGSITSPQLQPRVQL